MGMDLGTAIVGLVMILVCVIPFVILHYKRKNKVQKMLQLLNQQANNNNTAIKQFEHCGNHILAVDESNKFVFFITHQNQQQEVVTINLNNIQQCTVLKKTAQVKNDNRNYSIIQKVDLLFKAKDKNMADVKLELYDEEINMQLGDELQFAEKWVKHLNQLFKYKH